MVNLKIAAIKQAARERGDTKYFTGKPCKNGHVAERRLSDNHCVVCVYDKTKKRYENPEYAAKKKAIAREKYAADAEHRAILNERARRYREENRDEHLARRRERELERYYTEPDYREKRLRDNREWADSNPEKMRMYSGNWRAARRQASPPWLTPEMLLEIEKIYREAIIREMETGEPHAVDHIVPLQGELVCGLHVPWNLRVITRFENGSKQNKMPPDEELIAPEGWNNFQLKVDS